MSDVLLVVPRRSNPWNLKSLEVSRSLLKSLVWCVPCMARHRLCAWSTTMRTKLRNLRAELVWESSAKLEKVSRWIRWMQNFWRSKVSTAAKSEEMSAKLLCWCFLIWPCNPMPNQTFSGNIPTLRWGKLEPRSKHGILQSLILSRGPDGFYVCRVLFLWPSYDLYEKTANYSPRSIMIIYSQDMSRFFRAQWIWLRGAFDASMPTFDHAPKAGNMDGRDGQPQMY